MRPHGPDQLGGGQPVHARPLDVKKRDVALTGDRQPRSLLAVLGLADDLDLGMQAQQRAQKHARSLMVVGDDKADASFRAAFLRVGPHDIPSQRKSYRHLRGQIAGRAGSSDRPVRQATAKSRTAAPEKTPRAATDTEAASACDAPTPEAASAAVPAPA
jgi:hypothetical protein